MRNGAQEVTVEVKSMLSTSTSGRGLSQVRLQRRRPQLNEPTAEFGPVSDKNLLLRSARTQRCAGGVLGESHHYLTFTR